MANCQLYKYNKTFYLVKRDTSDFFAENFTENEIDPDHTCWLNYHSLSDRENIENWRQGWNTSLIEEVVVIDGVFMVGKRDSRIVFDERLQGFHNYDLFLSLIYNINHYKIVVTQKILLEHFSLGSINKSWFQSTLLFDRLFKEKLPMKLENTISAEQLRIQEYFSNL